MEILEVSCTTGEGLDQWMQWIKRRKETFKAESAKLPTLGC
jgi:hypothetical protein